MKHHTEATLKTCTKSELIDMVLNHQKLEREEAERQKNKLSVRIEIPLQLEGEEDVSDEAKKELTNMLANRMWKAVSYIG